MNNSHIAPAVAAAVATAIAASAYTPSADAKEPCGGFDECKVLVEINSTDGDVGFHFLMDAENLLTAAIFDPNGDRIFKHTTRGSLRDQTITETFAESSEPLCFDPLSDDDPENDDEDFVSLADFIDRFAAGRYVFFGLDDEGEKVFGGVNLSYHLPAAPQDIEFDSESGVVSWSHGEDLGECADAAQLSQMVMDGRLPRHPADIWVKSWEIVLEPDVDDGDIEYKVRIPGSISSTQVTVPEDFLSSLPDDTPAKIEVGAISWGDNATFSEEDGFCVNEDEGCEEDDD